MLRLSLGLAAAVLGFAPTSLQAAVEMPAIFGTGMVLQRDRSVPVWGRARPGEAITVNIASCTARTVTGADGSWSVRLDPLAAGGPYRMTVQGENTLVFDDVLIGEVWLGSGQSNMHMTVEFCRDFARERALANLPNLRMFTEESMPSRHAEWRGSGHWVVCTPESVGEFSGTLYFTGRELSQRLDLPIGLIVSSLGGTPIESWTSPEVQFSSPELAEFVSAKEAEFWGFDEKSYQEDYWKRRARWEQEVRIAEATLQQPPPPPRNLTEYNLRVGSIGHLFNGKIAPLIPYAIRGVVWYQGEANSRHAARYRHQLPLLVDDWRARWGQGDFPFLWVQLPNYVETQPGADWPMVREAMRRSLCIPNTGMAITIDLGEPHDIHPKNKQDVGKRIAAWILGSVYGFDVPTSGPLFQCLDVRGDVAVVRFTHTDGGLIGHGGPLRGFELAGRDHVWRAARAYIAGDRVLLGCKSIEGPISVRYAWSDNPVCNLYNGAGLPASPFTTLGFDSR